MLSPLFSALTLFSLADAAPRPAEPGGVRLTVTAPDAAGSFGVDVDGARLRSEGLWLRSGGVLGAASAATGREEARARGHADQQRAW